MSSVLPRAIGLAEFLALPETKPASEYFDGQIVQKPMPQGKHSYLQLELAAAINAALRKPRIARAGTELRCTFGGRSLVPDIAVVRWANIPRDADGTVANRFDRAPDWAIEILSPEQTPGRVLKNLLHCLDCGTELGWLVDPADATVFAYLPGGRVRVFDRPGDRLPVPAFARDLALTVGDLQDFLRD